MTTVHEQLELDVISVSFVYNADSVAVKHDFINKVFELPNPGVKTKLKKLFVETFLKQRYPM